MSEMTAVSETAVGGRGRGDDRGVRDCGWGTAVSLTAVSETAVGAAGDEGGGDCGWGRGRRGGRMGLEELGVGEDEVDG